MEAIVLAGGFGTRLAHIVSNVSKPMAPVANSPFLQYIFDNLIQNGITHIVVAVGYKKESIIEFFGQSYKGVRLSYSIEDSPLFTGGAIKKALELCLDYSVYIINGDTYYDVDLAAMKRLHKDKCADITIATKFMVDFDRYGCVVCDHTGKIISFKEKQFVTQGYINGGLYLLNRDVLSRTKLQKFSFEKDILEADLHQLMIYEYPSDGYFIDIGIPDDYYRAQKEFKKNFPMQPAAFFDRDGTVNVNFGHVFRPDELVFIKGTPELIKHYNDQNMPVIIITNQAGISKGYYSEQDMHKFNNYLNMRLNQEFGAHIDAFYFCPHHPEYTGECNCRKPKAGMILQAAKEWRIELKDSIMYGDKDSDRQAAVAAGVGKFVLIDS